MDTTGYPEAVQSERLLFRSDLTTGSVAVFKAMIVPEMDWDDVDQTIVYEWFCVTQKPSSDDSHIPDDSGNFRLA